MFSVYMVHLQGISNQFKIMWSMHFITNFGISLVNFLNVLGFLLLASEKNGGYTFLICYFLVINVYFFFNLLLFQWLWYIVTALGIFLMICSSVCNLWKVFYAILLFPSHLQENLEKKHTHHTVFLWKSMGKVFS